MHKTMHKVWLTVGIAMLFALGGMMGCGSDNTVVNTEVLNALIDVTPIAQGGTFCGGAGGFKIATGSDKNKNGVLDDDEIIGTPQIVCNGTSGQPGTIPELSVDSSTSCENAPSCVAKCGTAGGVHIVLSIGSGGSQQASLDICNGENGEEGVSPTIKKANCNLTGTQDALDTACAAACGAVGGIKLWWEEDTNGKPLASAGTFICNGLTGTDGDGKTPIVRSAACSAAISNAFPAVAAEQSLCRAECGAADGLLIWAYYDHEGNYSYSDGSASHLCNGLDRTSLMASERCTNTCAGNCLETGSGVKIWAYEGTPTNVLPGSTSYVCDASGGTNSGPQQGYSVTDPWGDVWDGTERKAATWQVAYDTCDSLGGRLPTGTELWRNAYPYTYSDGILGTNLNTNPLWTLIASTGGLIANSYVAVRLSDGFTNHYVATASYPYRCIWPKQPSRSQGFNEDHCHADPNSSNRCYLFDRFYNVDMTDRAPMNMTAAANECRFYGAGLPTMGEWERLIHEGLPSSQAMVGAPALGAAATISTNTMWHLSTSPYRNAGAGIKWAETNDLYNRDLWNIQTANNLSNFGSNEAFQNSTTANGRTFRCIGLKDRASVALPNASCQNGPCMSMTHRRSPIVADNANRVSDTFANSIQDCLDANGTMATLSDAIDLIHGTDWAQTDANNRIRLMNFYQINRTDATIYWLDNGAKNGIDGNEHWSYSSVAGSIAATTNAPYRCVWHPKKPAWPTCTSPNVVVWNKENQRFDCQIGADGNAQGLASNGSGVEDAWKNRWDDREVGPSTWAVADQDCRDRGGRLPTMTELWGIRPGGDTTVSPATLSAATPTTIYLWSLTPVWNVPINHYALLAYNGTIASRANATATTYRCIFPNKRGDVLQGRNCYGQPGSECFETPQGLTMDKWDRINIDRRAAAFECAQSGGRLPAYAELLEAIYSGAPNGKNSWLWTADEFDHDGIVYVHAVYRWNETGDSTWVPTYSGNLSYARPDNTGIRFRCVYSPYLK